LKFGQAVSASRRGGVAGYTTDKSGKKSRVKTILRLKYIYVFTNIKNTPEFIEFHLK
jgi:hypothetical protein